METAPVTGDLTQFGFVAQLCLAAVDVDQALSLACRFAALWSKREIVYERAGHEVLLRSGPHWEHADAPVQSCPVASVMSWVQLVARVAATQVVPSAVHVCASHRAALT